MAKKKGVEIEVIGAKELKKLFVDINDDALSLAILKDINRAGANLYKKELKSKAPKTVKKNIKVSAIKDDKTGLIIGPTSGAFWARFLEKGTKVRKGPRGRISPKPFVWPTIESNETKVVNEIYNKMSKRVLNWLKRKTKNLNNKIKKLK